MKKFTFGGRSKIKLKDTAFDPTSPNGKSCVPAPTSKSVKAEGVGGWGFDPMWGGSKQDGLNMGEINAIAALDRKKNDKPMRERIGVKKAQRMKRRGSIRPLIAEMESILARYK